MKIIDSHQDLLLHLTNLKPGQSVQTNFDLLRKANARAIFGAVFIDDPIQRQDPNVIIEQLTKYQKLIKQNNFIQIKNQDDLDRTLNQDEFGILLHLEGADAINSQNYKTTLKQLIDLGLRSVGIVWNNKNDLGSGANQSGGLTELGRKVIKYLDQNDIIIDLAHMNEQTFQDTLEIINNPPLISHGNARFYSDLPRNYSDTQLKAVADRNGMICVFMSPRFVRQGDSVTLGDLIAQIEYIVDLVGIDHVGLGSDFGGITANQMIPGLEKVTDLQNIVEALQAHGYTEQEIEKITHKNMEQYIKSRLC
jgi:membrane dipeptidase